ncbi:MAG: flagellar basal body P-ring protein FlgI, partial [Armatimonadetes bacterium]|nr:flagellar basal body P-ring protein FlgI [Armatimonadota bacterium]
MNRLTATLATTLVAATLCLAQGGAVGTGTSTENQEAANAALLLKQQRERNAMDKAEREGVSVRMKDIGRFRGVRSNPLIGYGIVVGLGGTGDSQQTPFTATLLQNSLQRWGTKIDATKFRPKNVAAVSITAELAPFAAPGNFMDITVSSIGDAKSLEGGTLLLAPLFGPSDFQNVIAVAQGSISIGGFNAGSGGSSSRKNHANVGRIPGGAIIERSVATQTLFDGNKLFFELYVPDLTTSQRVATALAKEFPEFFVTPIDGGSIQIVLPEGQSAMMAMSQIEQATVFADVPAVVVVNERTGTIVIGGNVRLGPAVIAHGS